MRLFVAIRPPEVVVRHLDDALSAQRGLHPGLRWVPAASWHVTLAFLGAVGPAPVPQLERRLGRAAARSHPFRLQLAGAARFGDRVIFTRVEGERAALSALAAATSAAARRSGIALDERSFRPHLTLARSRGGVDLAPVVAGLSGYLGPEWTASTVELIESRPPGAAGRSPTYVSVGGWPLGSPSG